MFSFSLSALIIFKQAHFKCILMHSGAHNPRDKALVFIAAHKISEHFLSSLPGSSGLSETSSPEIFGKQCVHVLDHWYEYVLSPVVFRCWFLIHFLLSFYLLLGCCLGSWDKAKLHLSETVFVLVLYARLLKNISIFGPLLFFFLSSLWFLFWCSRVSSGWNLCGSLLFAASLPFNHCSAVQLHGSGQNADKLFIQSLSAILMIHGAALALTKQGIWKKI